MIAQMPSRCFEAYQGLPTMKRRRRLAGVAVGSLLVASILAGCGRFSFSAKEREAYAAEGRRVFTEKGCTGCHTVGPVGTPIAPDLLQTARRYTESALAQWLQHPSAQVPTRHMPDLHLTEAEANAVAAYIVTLR
jgi:mono/diheme cytochrome c family protein